MINSWIYRLHRHFQDFPGTYSTPDRSTTRNHYFFCVFVLVEISQARSWRSPLFWHLYLGLRKLRKKRCHLSHALSTDLKKTCNCCSINVKVAFSQAWADFRGITKCSLGSGAGRQYLYLRKTCIGWEHWLPIHRIWDKHQARSDQRSRRRGGHRHSHKNVVRNRPFQKMTTPTQPAIISKLCQSILKTASTLRLLWQCYARFNTLTVEEI
jgi:hypothetical protein